MSSKKVKVRRNKPMCLCVPCKKWTDDEINEYLRNHPNDSIMHVNKELQGLNVYVAREIAEQKMPFKVKYCTKPNLCCGACTRHRCQFRCIQDLLNRYYIHLYPYLSGFKDISKASFVDKNLYGIYMSKTSNHTQYVRGLEDIMTDESVNDYTPYTEWELTKGGRYMRKIDPSTGIVSILNWPNSGLCPYCEPRVQVVSTTHRKQFNAPKR